MALPSKDPPDILACSPEGKRKLIPGTFPDLSGKNGRHAGARNEVRSVSKDVAIFDGQSSYAGKGPPHKATENGMRKATTQKRAAQTDDDLNSLKTITFPFLSRTAQEKDNFAGSKRGSSEPPFSLSKRKCTRRNDDFSLRESNAQANMARKSPGNKQKRHQHSTDKASPGETRTYSDVISSPSPINHAERAVEDWAHSDVCIYSSTSYGIPAQGCRRSAHLCCSARTVAAFWSNR